MVGAHVLNTDNIQGRLAAPQPPNNIVVDVFIADEAKPKKLSLEEYVAGEDAA